MNDPDNTYTEAQLKQLASVLPDRVRICEDGRIIPLVTREEVRSLARRYPSCFKREDSALQNAPEDKRAMRARYPSMFKT
jgi:hypothetical protein